MTHDHDVFVGIEFLVSPGRHIPHGNVFYAFEVGGIVFPRLANIEQRECVAALLQRFDLIRRNLEFHIQKSIIRNLQSATCLAKNQAPSRRASGTLANVVRLNNAASAHSTPVPMRAERISDGEMSYQRVSPHPMAKFKTSTLKNRRSRRQRVSRARPVSRRIHTT